MDLKLTGKRALIFGSSSGIGYAIAKVLKDEGAEVIINGNNLNKLQASAERLGCKYIQGDLKKAGVAARIVKEAGLIDILVTNTGGPATGKFETITNDQWLEGFQNLYLSAIDAINGVLPNMRAQKYGRIILITSLAAKEPVNNLTISNSLRAGLLGMCKTLSSEVAGDNITVNSILPGYTATERLVELGHTNDQLLQNIPAKRLADPIELGHLAAFLASPQAGYITGQMITVDGGANRSY